MVMRAASVLALLATALASGCGSGVSSLPAAAPSATVQDTVPSTAVRPALSAPMPEYACGASGPGWPAGSQVADYEAYEGLTLQEAQDLADESGDLLRVLGTDGTCDPRAMRTDLRSNRVNVYPDSGTVVSAYAH